MMAYLTNVQLKDLRAISRNPGCYSKCKEDGELMTLVNMGLIRWRYTGGYEITSAGRAARREHGEDDQNQYSSYQQWKRRS